MGKEKKESGEIVLMNGEQFLTKRQVSAITARSATSLWRDVKAGRFPEPRQLGPLRIGWLKSEVMAWVIGCPPASAKNHIS